MGTNIDIIKDFQKLIANGAYEKAMSLISDGAIWHSDEIGAPWSGIHKGKTNILKHFHAINGTTKGFKRFKQQFIDQGNLIIEIGSLSCVLAKTGKPFDTEYVCLYEVSDGQLISYRIFEDSLKLYKAYFGTKDNDHGLTFKKSVASIADNDMAKIIKADDIDMHFPAPSPGAINLFDDVSMSVGMVKTEDYPSYPHKNDYDEVHYVINGAAKFRHGNNPASEIEAGDVVYVKAEEEHEWFECSKDFELIFVQAKSQE